MRGCHNSTQQQLSSPEKKIGCMVGPVLQYLLGVLVLFSNEATNLGCGPGDSHLLLIPGTTGSWHKNSSYPCDVSQIFLLTFFFMVLIEGLKEANSPDTVRTLQKTTYDHVRTVTVLLIESTIQYLCKSSSLRKALEINTWFHYFETSLRQ